jgi:hypothetical protein
MKAMRMALAIWLAAGASASAACPPEILKRFPAAQARVLCGEQAPDYQGTGLEHSPPGNTCLTKAGACPLSLAAPQGAPCECSLSVGRVAGFIVK